MKKIKKSTSYTLLFVILTAFIASSCIDDHLGRGNNIGAMKKVLKKFYNVESIEIVKDTIIITTLDLPDHTSPFYEESNPLFEEYTGDNPDFSTEITLPTGVTIDPDLMATEFVFKLPLRPKEVESDNQPTNLGPIGVALNGVVFFNQFNGRRELLDQREFNNTDQWNGHPSPRLSYHYHIEPIWLTQNMGSDALLGVLLDGFPVYGPVEDGVTLTSDDLDEFHGHFGKTADFRKGIYHYHFTEDAPWLNGDGYKGTPGILIE